MLLSFRSRCFSTAPSQNPTSMLLQLQERVKEDNVARLLKSCTEAKDLSGGKRVHSRINQSDHLRNNTFLANLLIHMYSKCSTVNSARAVFDQLTRRNVFSWNLLVSAYAANGFAETALSLYNLMAFQSLVACTAVIESLGHVGALASAKRLFDSVPEKDRVLSNAMISAFAKNGDLPQAERLLQEMKGAANVVSWSTVMMGHALQEKWSEAERVFLQMPVRNDVVWGGLISVYCQSKNPVMVHQAFRRMAWHDVGVWVMVMTIMMVRVGKVEKMFERIPVRNPEVWRVMAATYSEAGELGLARTVLERMPQHSFGAWECLIRGYLREGKAKRAKRCFDALPENLDGKSWQMLVAATPSVYDKRPNDSPATTEVPDLSVISQEKKKPLKLLKKVAFSV